MPIGLELVIAVPLGGGPGPAGLQGRQGMHALTVYLYSRWEWEFLHFTWCSGSWGFREGQTCTWQTEKAKDPLIPGFTPGLGQFLT